MAIGFCLFFAAVLGIAFVVLALSERRTYSLQVIYALVAAILTFVLGVTFGSLGFDHSSHTSSTRLTVERGIISGLEVESATHWATRGFGGWLVVMAAGELLRLVLKRSDSTQFVGPTILFLAGGLLIEPHWGLGVAIAGALMCATALAIWGRRETSATSAPGVISQELSPESPNS